MFNINVSVVDENSTRMAVVWVAQQMRLDEDMTDTGGRNETERLPYEHPVFQEFLNALDLVIRYGRQQRLSANDKHLSAALGKRKSKD